MELLSQPIKVNYQRQNAGRGRTVGGGGGGWLKMVVVGGVKSNEERALRWSSTALMNSITSEDRERSPSSTYQRQTVRAGGRGKGGSWGEGNADELVAHFVVSVTIEVPPVSRCCSPRHLHEDFWPLPDGRLRSGLPH